MNILKNDTLQILNFLFPEPLELNEKIEIHHGPHGHAKYSNWVFAQHHNSPDEAIKWIEKQNTTIYDCPRHMGIHWTTKTGLGGPKTKENPKGRENKRSRKNHVHRAWGIIIDVEDVDNHGHILQADVEKFFWNIEKHLPKWLKNHYNLVAWTGGGLHLYVRFTEVMEGHDLQLLAEALNFFTPKNLSITLKNGKTQKVHPYIDLGSFQTTHGQRLIGSENPKYTNPPVVTQIIPSLCHHEAEPLDPLPIMLEYKKATAGLRPPKTAKKDHKPQLERMSFKDLKKRVSMAYIFGINIKTRVETADPPYSKCYCPLHEEKHPSFTIYHNATGDVGECHHGGGSFKGDVFSLFKEINPASSNFESFQWVAEQGGIDLNLDTPPEIEEAKEEAEITASKGYQWLMGNGIDTDNIKIAQYDEFLELHFKVKIPGRSGERSLIMKDTEFININNFKMCVMRQLKTKFFSYMEKADLMELAIDIVERHHDQIEDRRVIDVLTGEYQSHLLAEIQRVGSWITPSDLAKWQKKPERSSDASDFMTIGQSVVLLTTSEGVYLRWKPLLRSLKADRQMGWTNEKVTAALNTVGFHIERSKESVKCGEKSHRMRLWRMPIERAEKLRISEKTEITEGD